MRNAEGEDAGLEGVRHAGHRPDQRVAVRRVRDRPVDDLRKAGGAQDRHAGDGVGKIVLQPVEIIGEELEGEILRHRIVMRRPMRAAIALIGAKIHASLFLAQVIGRVDVAQQRQFFALFLRPCGKLRDLLEQDVLMAHHHHRHFTAEHAAHLGGTVAGCIDDDLAADLALWRRDHPFAILAANAGDRAESDDFRAHIARALGERLGQLRWERQGHGSLQMGDEVDWLVGTAYPLGYFGRVVDGGRQAN